MYKWEIFFAGNPAKKGYEAMRGETKPVQNFLRKKVLVIRLYRVAVGAAGRQPVLQGWERASFHSPLHRLVNPAGCIFPEG